MQNSPLMRSPTLLTNSKIGPQNPNLSKQDQTFSAVMNIKKANDLGKPKL